MAEIPDHISQTIRFFEEKLAAYGPTAQGIDYNGIAAVHNRYSQILRALTQTSGFSMNDFGCGYGALVEYMQANGYCDFDYVGYDVAGAMIEEARRSQSGPRTQFVLGDRLALMRADYTVAQGVFNMKLATPEAVWADYVRDCLRTMYAASSVAMSANFLTSYSDKDRMRDDLYYPDPGELFAFAKSLSRNVSLLHDYDLYDFTLIVRRVAY